MSPQKTTPLIKIKHFVNAFHFWVIACFGIAHADQISRVSVDSAGMEGTGASTKSRISGDGRFVVFLSQSQLDSDDTDTGGRTDIFLRDRLNGTTTLISRLPALLASNSGVTDDEPDVSDDGNLVVYLALSNVFLYNVSDNTTTEIGSNPALAAVGASLSFPTNVRISADGRYIAYAVANSNSTETASARYDIFIYDTVLNSAELVSVDVNNTSPPGGSAGALEFEMSADGRKIIFVASSDELVPSDNNSRSDVFLRDLDNQTTTLVSVDESGQQFPFSPGRPDISSAGNVAVFLENGLGGQDKIRVATEFGTSSKFVGISTCNRASSFGSSPRISGDGRYIVGGEGSLVHDRVTGETRTLRETSQRMDDANVNADGRLITFTSSESDLVPNDNNNTLDIFVYERSPVSVATSDPTLFTLAPDQWEMLTLPCNVSADTTVNDLFGDDITGTYGTDWRIFTYNPYARLHGQSF
jgi:Tol biopolymer transport system component